MIVSEFTRMSNQEIPIIIICIFLMVFFTALFMAVGGSTRKIRENSAMAIIASVVAVFIALGIYIFGFMKIDNYQYYSYSSDTDIEELEQQGWKVINNYENRKIIYIKKVK